MISHWERCETGTFPSLVLSELSLYPNHAHAFCLGSTQDPTAPHSVFTQNTNKLYIFYKPLPLIYSSVTIGHYIRRKVLERESVAQSNIRGVRKVVLNWENNHIEELLPSTDYKPAGLENLPSV